jgi:hypothetical protein
MKLYEHNNFNGAELRLETASNSVIWTHGPWNCYRTTANSNLTYEPRFGGNWNDVISSTCINFQNGADAVAYGYYADPSYAHSWCGYLIQVWQSYQLTFQHCSPLQTSYWNGNFCGNMNDQISSLRMQMVWQACPQNFDDM